MSQLKARDRYWLILLIVTGVLLRGRIENGPLWGDDALLLRASRFSGGFSSDVLASTFQTGSSKSRPLLQPILAAMLRVFGNNQFWYLFISSALVIAISCIVFKTLKALGASSSIAWLTSSIVLVTRFNWYAQDNVFGTMEALALLLALLSLYGLLQSVREEVVNLKKVTTSILLLCAATFVHERYVLVALAIPTSLVLAELLLRNPHTKEIAKASTAFMSIPVLHIIWKEGLQNVSSLTGGGESNFETVIGLWIGKNFLQVLTSISGWSSGYRELEEIADVPSVVFVSVSILVLTVLVAGLIDIGVRSKSRTLVDSGKLAQIILIGGVFCAMSISASLVIERIEYRWLFGPLVLFLFFVQALLSSSTLKMKRVLSIIVPLVLVTEFLYQPLHKPQRINERRVANAVIKLEQFGKNNDVEKEEPFKLVISATNWNPSWQWWTLAYGNVFLQTINPPVVLVLSSTENAYRDCQRDWNLSSCIWLQLDGETDQVTVSRIDLSR